MPRRRLTDLIADVQLLEVQLQIMSETGGPHRIRNQGVRLSALHQRLDTLERRLRRRARMLGENDRGTLTELRQRLAAHRPQPRDIERRAGANRLSEPARDAHTVCDSNSAASNCCC